MAKIKLLCFPYAGGTASIYNSWASHFSENVELQPVELKGRGKRIKETHYFSIDELINDVLLQIQTYVKSQEYALFGHSMGALICYELYQRLKELKMPLPLHLFFSGFGAPNVPRPDKKKYHLMDNMEFREEIIKLGGTPPEIFEHKELIDVFVPLLKNDFRLVETRPNKDPIIPLGKNITVLIGKEDDMTEKQIQKWNEHTTEICTIYKFNGGHFFLHDHYLDIIDIINKVIQKEKVPNFTNINSI